MTSRWIKANEEALHAIVEAELDYYGIEGRDRPVLVVERGAAPVLTDGVWRERVMVRTFDGMRRQIRRWIASILGNR